MPTLQDWISQRPPNLDVVTPVKARACDAVQALLRSRRRPGPVTTEVRLMRKGAERC